jgi:branched-chain amino acid transport system substrate-binding protein
MGKYSKVRRPGAILLSMIAILTLAACGNESPTSTPVTVPATATTAALEATATTALAGITPSTSTLQGTVKVGIMLPLTGSQAEVGSDEKRGYDMAIQDINSKGGISGAQIEAVYEDTKGDPTTSAQAAQRLISEEKVVAILGEYSSSTTAATYGVCKQAQQLCMLVGGSSISLDKDFGGSPWYWHLSPYGTYYATTAKAFFQSLSPAPSSIAIVYEDTLYGSSLSTALRDALADSNIKVVSFESFTAGSSDYSSLLTKVQQTNPDILFINSFPQDTIALWTQAKQLNFAPKMMIGTAGVSFPGFQTTLGKDANFAADIEVWVPSVSYTGTKDWVARFNTAYGKDPTYWAPISYINLEAFAKAVSAAGSLDQAKIEGELAKVKYDSIMGPFSFDDRHQAFKDVIVFQIQNGQKVVVYPAAAASGKIEYPAPGWSER